MLNLLKQRAERREQKLIRQIHDEVDSAQDRLLNQALSVLAGASGYVAIPEADKAARLARAGFTSARVVRDVGKKESERKAWQSFIAMTRKQANLIQHYKTTYPFLKFLTEEELDRICAKYNLIYAPVSRYTEDVPEKNLVEIEQAQELRERDKAENLRLLECTDFYKWVPDSVKVAIEKGVPYNGSDWLFIPEVHSALKSVGVNINHEDIGRPISSDVSIKIVDRQGLFICAPKSHFDLADLSKEGVRGFFSAQVVVKKDPIVFRYCRGGVQVLTKWGLEANDEAIAVEVTN